MRLCASSTTTMFLEPEQPAEFAVNLFQVNSPNALTPLMIFQELLVMFFEATIMCSKQLSFSGMVQRKENRAQAPHTHQVIWQSDDLHRGTSAMNDERVLQSTMISDLGLSERFTPAVVRTHTMCSTKRCQFFNVSRLRL